MYKLSISRFGDKMWNGKKKPKNTFISTIFPWAGSYFLSKHLFCLPERVISSSNGLLPEFCFEALLSFGEVLLSASEKQAYFLNQRFKTKTVFYVLFVARYFWFIWEVFFIYHYKSNNFYKCCRCLLSLLKK